MNELLHDLYGHQTWADAEHWKSLESWPSAIRDEAICKRLHHIHLTQRAFLSIVRGEPLTIKRLEDFPDMAALKDYAHAYHDDVADFLKNATSSELALVHVIPWFMDPPISVTASQALVQAAMHSHYHRAQNASRLRELGAQPPLTDLIVWYWKEKPHANWE